MRRKVGWGYWFRWTQNDVMNGLRPADAVYRITKTVRASDLTNGDLSLLFGARQMQTLQDESWGAGQRQRHAPAGQSGAHHYQHARDAV